MIDEEFLGYCEIHCRTERALFAKSDVIRLLELAHVDTRPFDHVRDEWIEGRYDAVQPLVNTARRILNEVHDENVIARGFVEGDLEP